LLKTIGTVTFAIAAIACLAAGDVRAEADFLGVRPLKDPAAFLRLRPLKEPAGCVATGGPCPLVTAPRINKRRSTIPGTSNPDYGRPPVVKLQPPMRGFASPYRTFGGNRGITGGL
jgi:hypothetical protein